MKLKKGKLFVIEGLDGCGKNTQARLLQENLKINGIDSKLISFPNYLSSSSSLVKSYLNGDFGDDSSKINYFMSSSFYAVDRIATYITEMKDYLDNGGIIIADRYTTSNMLYQSNSINNFDEKESFLEWVFDFEYNKLGLPEPTKVFFLNLKYDTFISLLKKRDNNKHEGKDILEKDLQVLRRIYTNSKYVREKYNWEVINCEDNKPNSLKNKESISKLIYQNVAESHLL